MITYTKRLADADFAAPPWDSRAALLGLIRNASAIIERREEASGASYLRGRVMVRFDGTLGGDPTDDLVVNATAQLALTRIATAILQTLEGGTRGTRAGEPNPPPPNTPGDPGPEPTPDPGGSADNGASFSGITFTAVTHTNAVASWDVEATPPVTSSWVDWGIASVAEHRTYDNSTPYQVTLSPLQPNTTYKVQAGAFRHPSTYQSDAFTFFVGIAITNLAITNQSSTTATVEWNTNLPATSVVLYGTNESNLVFSKTSGSGTFHQVNLTSLASGATYYLRAKSVALADATLVGLSGTLSFQAQLRIFQLTRSATQIAGSYDVTFKWSTNFNGTSVVRWGPTHTLSSTPATGASGFSHRVVLTGLPSNSSYLWQAYSQMVAGSDYACVSSKGITLMDQERTDTFCSPGDPGVDRGPIKTPPIGVVNITFNRGQTWILAKWNTTYAGNAAVMWWQGTGAKHAKSVSGSTLVHSVNITGYPDGSGLSTGATYTLQLNSTSTSNAGDTGRFSSTCF